MGRFTFVDPLGQSPSHDHSHDHHGHDHSHDHHHPSTLTSPPPFAEPSHTSTAQTGDVVVVVRTPSGLSGDMLVTGLARLAGATNADLAELLAGLRLPALKGSIQVQAHSVNDISGWKAQVDLPPEHAHRTFSDIENLLKKSALSDAAQTLAINTFRILAEAEARVHGIDVAHVAFHEVGALDSILDIGLAAALYIRIGAKALHCSALPLCDGTIRCEHGVLASPAPAVQEMLTGVPVYGIASRGETVTPTALAFLRGVNAVFGLWPAMRVRSSVRAYGGRVLPGIPNGAIFTLGEI